MATVGPTGDVNALMVTGFRASDQFFGNESVHMQC